MQYFKTKRAEKPKEERIKHYRPQGEELDKAYSYHVQKSRTDEAEMTEKREKSEKITVSEGEIPRTEQYEKPRYPRAIDIGRIVIDEIPEEKQPPQKREIPKGDEVQGTIVDIKPCDKFDGRPKIPVKEDAVKVGRLNITDHEITLRESDRSKIHQMVICPSL